MIQFCMVGEAPEMYMPLDILPTQLLRTLIIRDTDIAQAYRPFKRLLHKIDIVMSMR